MTADLDTPDLSTPPTDDPRPEHLDRAPSLVIVNTGDGKGKSTAAFGIVMRALAREWRVAVIQFLKSGAWRTGEEKIARQPRRRLVRDRRRVHVGLPGPHGRPSRRRRGLAARQERSSSAGEHRLVVLDEITYPMNWGWIDPDDVVDHDPGPRPTR